MRIAPEVAPSYNNLLSAAVVDGANVWNWRGRDSDVEGSGVADRLIGRFWMVGVGDHLYGRPNSMSGVSSISYNVAGQVTQDTLGNGVTEQFGYDAARMQITSQKAGTTSPYTNRMDLT